MYTVDIVFVGVLSFPEDTFTVSYILDRIDNKWILDFSIV